MNLGLLQRELIDVRDSVLAVVNAKEERESLLHLNGLLSTLQNSTSSLTTVNYMSCSWGHLLQLTSLGRNLSLVVRKQHMMIMLLSHHMWYWLDIYVAKTAREFLELPERPVLEEETWLKSLVDNVKAMYVEHLARRTFIAAAYGIKAVPGNKEHTITLDFRQWPQTKQASHIVSTVIEIIQSWLQFPTHSNARVQAWFVHVIITQFDPRLLYLDYIWTTYNNVVKNLFRRGTWHLDSFSCVKSIVDAAPDHPLFNTTSKETKIIMDLGQIVDDFVSGKLTSGPRGNGESAINTNVSQLPQSLRNVAEDRVAIFKSFIRYSMNFVLFLSMEGVPSSLVTMFTGSGDKSIPFRELAPGRSRFKSPEGPFAPNVVRTTEGIFSALVWRGITFAAPFSLDNTIPMVFNSAFHFDQECTKESHNGKPASFFCDPAAYGVHNPQRMVSLAQSYWASLKGDIWPDFVRNRIVPFKECYSFFRTRVKAGTTTVPRFPNIGPLTSYLITADLFYSGVVERPSVQDIAWIIKEVNKGPVAALEGLGLVTLRRTKSSKPNITECQAALKYVYGVVCEVVPEEHRETLHIDYIMLENSLCKFSRGSTKGWLQS